MRFLACRRDTSSPTRIGSHVTDERVENREGEILEASGEKDLINP